MSAYRFDCVHWQPQALLSFKISIPINVAGWNNLWQFHLVRPFQPGSPSSSSASIGEMEEEKPRLDELSKSYNELNSINEKQEKRVRYLETRAINLVISYCFYQAIIFFSVSHSSNLFCNKRWIPFSLSLFVAVIAGPTFASAILNWAGTQYHYESNLLELEILHYQMFVIKNSHVQIRDNKYQQQDLEPDMFKVYQRHAYLFAISFALVAFTVVILHAIWTAPCSL